MEVQLSDSFVWETDTDFFLSSITSMSSSMTFFQLTPLLPYLVVSLPRPTFTFSLEKDQDFVTNYNLRV